MGKDLFGNPETVKERATRIWRNHEVSERFKKMRATGKGSEQFPVHDGKKFFSTEIPKPPKSRRNQQKSLRMKIQRSTSLRES